MNFFDHKDLGNHLLQLSPKVVKHPVYTENHTVFLFTEHILLLLFFADYFVQAVNQLMLVHTMMLNFALVAVRTSRGEVRL
jgi:hypothetical protein